MLAILLTILKIIGITLLIILGTVIVILLLVLFWPFSYKINGDNRQKMNGAVTVSWFFHLLHVKAYYQDEFNIEARVLGIKIYDKLKKDGKFSSEDSVTSSDKKKAKEKKEKDKAKDKRTVKDEESYEEIGLIDDNNLNIENDSNVNNEFDDNMNFEEEDEADFADWLDDSDSEKADGSSKEKKNLFKKIVSKFKSKKKISFKDWLSDIFDKIWDFIDDLYFKVSDFCEKPATKVDELVDTYIYYDRILSSKGTDWVINFVKVKVIKILKALKPYRSDINIDYSSTDPEKAAKMFEIYAMTRMIHPKHTHMNVGFVEDDFKFDARVKGRFVLGVIAFHALTLIFNKKVKKFIKLMKREDK